MAMDIEQQVTVGVKKSHYFSIQFDESTDASNCAILLCFVRLRKKQILRKNFFAVLTYQHLPPSRKYLNFLTSTLVRKNRVGNIASECVPMELQPRLVITLM